MSKRLGIILAVFGLFAVIMPVRAEEGGGGIFAWWGNMRRSEYTKAYDIDTATADKLAEIVRNSKLQQKSLQSEENALLAKLEIALSEKKSDEEISSLLEQIKAKKNELGQVESNTIVKVQELLGIQKTAKFVLSQRGMFQRVKGSVRRSESNTESREEVKPRTSSSHTGY